MDSLIGTLEITIMVFMIIAASNTFSSLLAYTGATTGLVATVQGLQVSPLLILVGMNIVVLIMGCFMETIAIMMITLPIFMPIITTLGFDPVWFGVIILVNCETGMLTPPFGMLLFVMKGVAPSDITMQDIIRAAFPYILIYIVSLAVLIAFPSIIVGGSSLHPGIRDQASRRYSQGQWERGRDDRRVRSPPSPRAASLAVEG